MIVSVFRHPAARETEKLEELPAVFLAETVIGQHGIGEVIFFIINIRVPGVGKGQGWNGPLMLGFLQFGIKKRAQNLPSDGPEQG